MNNKRNYSVMTAILLSILIGVFTTCKRENPDLSALNPIDSLEGTQPPDSAGVDDPDDDQNNGDDDIEIVLMGTGNGGNLTIDGNTRQFNCKQRIRIKGGSYNSIQIQNLKGEPGCPIIIENEGLVELDGNGKQIRLSNLDQVTVRGNAVKNIAKGFIVKNNSNRAIEIDEAINNFSLQYFSFENIGDYVISYPYYAVYNGNSNSYSENISFTHISCRQTGPFLVGGGSIKDGFLDGLVKNLEIAFLDFQNSPGVGSVVKMGNVEAYNIHDNLINNINSSNTNHNGIFMLDGNGKFYNNIVTNHQGNAIRAWTFSIGTTPKEVLIYNNIVYNSIKYSAFEVQSFDSYISPGKTIYANVKVFNNTCGRMNTSRDWDGAVIDVYSLKGGKCEVFNNLAFDFPKADLIWTIQNDTAPTGSNNLYFSSSSSAGISDLKQFKLISGSKAKNSGLKTTLITKDIYGTLRGTPPSVGAVE